MNSVTHSHSVQAANIALKDWLALGARVFLALIFILAGYGKIADPTGTIGYITSVGLPLPELAYIGAVGVELLGGIALVLGFKTRATATVLAIFSLVTAVAFHNQLGDQIQFIMFFKNVALVGGFLQVAAFGPGRFSIDRN